MNKKVLTGLMISIMPFNAFRVWLYRNLMGYSIGRESKIKMFTLIAVDSFSVGERVQIGPLNYFKGPISVKFGNDVWFGRQNQVNSSWHIAQSRFLRHDYGREFVLGNDVVVQHQHYFDVYGRLHVGNGSWIVGRGSQFWTHGLSVQDRDIVIGDNNVISSGVRFSPGSGVGSGNVVALASVVLKNIDVNDCIIGGFPAVVVKDISVAKQNGQYHFSRADWG